ncbi:TaqI-like C-terminal specificity domain-containing protein [Marinicrinis sediminis]|uniref:site-specific DNA-methyltransferase (adenine-specific) n=1 Tax=Marinicrinis sediminis TaxID=1652465 RepID=A0ABW5RC16_9BACL
MNERIHPDHITLEETAGMLSVSTGTVRNWVKSGKIKYRIQHGRRMYYDLQEIRELQGEIISGHEMKLKSRRNKKALNGTRIPDDYVSSAKVASFAKKLLAHASKRKVAEYPTLILFELALRLMVKRSRFTGWTSENDQDLVSTAGLPASGSYVERALREPACLHPYQDLFAGWLENASTIDSDRFTELARLPLQSVPWQEGDDLLGLVYMGLSQLKDRKSGGIYYTPRHLVQTLTAEATRSGFEYPAPKMVDPCSGSGNFLIQLFLTLKQRWMLDGIAEIEAEQLLLEQCLYGYDIDATAIQLARVNLCLLAHYEVQTENLHLQCKNVLAHYDSVFPFEGSQSFDLVIGNPPWGYSFTKEEMRQYRHSFLIADRNALESFDLFIEAGLDLLKVSGILAYVLPESFLNVKLHASARKWLLERSEIQHIQLMGMPFQHVSTPVMTLTACKGKQEEEHQIRVSEQTHCFKVRQRRFLIHDFAVLNIRASDEEEAILKQMQGVPGVQYLKGQAEFALGIVTGNNGEFVLDEPIPGTEPVLKGADIFKYRCKTGRNYLHFDAARFQQVASEQLYRAPEKLIYRFINKSLIFAYDDQQRLTLNSANIVIPRLKRYSMKYVMAILNARAAQFYFAAAFDSVKILRKHIESIPIPPCSRKQHKQIVALVDQIRAADSVATMAGIYEELDSLVCGLYALEDRQRQLVLQKYANVKYMDVVPDLV